MSVRIEVVDAATTSELRRAVLRPHWRPGTPMATTNDTVHLGAFDGDELVGACTLTPGPYPLHPDQAGAWQLGGMATAPDRRGLGIGAELLRQAGEEVRDRGGQLIWCNARTSARGFYERHGYTAEGPEFLHAEPLQPHFRMWSEPAATATSSA